MFKFTPYVLLIGSLGILSACSSIEVPNRPVVQVTPPVTMKPIGEFTSRQPTIIKQPEVSAPIKCAKGKKGYTCRHPKKGQEVPVAIKPSQPIVTNKLVKPIVVAQATKSVEVPNAIYRFESGAVIEIREVSTVTDNVTVKNVGLLQNQRGDLILSQGMILKVTCFKDGTSVLNQINGKKFTIPVAIQNQDHQTTGCNKTNGAIKYMQIIANVI